MYILVVDDEPGDCQTMADTLTRAGYNVSKAGDAVTAARLMAHEPKIDLLVTDISLPGTNGCELARQMLADRPELKILFVSGYVGSEVCRYYGVPITDSLFLRKPFTSKELLERVNAVLASTEPVTLSAPTSGAGGAA